ncbi:MAG: tyrosine--tRNA ligase, partial [Rhodospirillaceae bacterium]|nr:tyrosine--tRNA ligase [Rhodospirillaceae bacterium]
EWFDKMGFGECLNLARNMTVAQMLERDDFAKRHIKQTPISIVEFLYPLVQGYDSVVLNADIELGGSDQLFNMLVGRSLQKEVGDPEQAVLTMPLLVGLDGSRKMSKSYDNYIAFNDNSKEMFGKVMSIPDDTMWDYYRLLLLTKDCDIDKLKSGHPMVVKKNLANKITAKFHGKEVADKEVAQFEKVFSKGQNPDEMPIFKWGTLSPNSKGCTLVDIIAGTKLFESKGEIRRLIKQGAVKLNDQTNINDQIIITKPDSNIIIRAGKRRYFKVCP